MLTVILASRNGEDVLPKTLDAFSRMASPPGGWKLIAVDNASTDSTRDVIHSYLDRLPLTPLSEPIPGKNRALNLALAHAEGDVYIFCDDDVIVAPDWLIKWHEVTEAHQEYGLFAGCIRPLWPTDPPHWLLHDKNCGILFGSHEGINDGPCDVILTFGANMAIRSSVFRDGTRFNVDIGPSNSPAYGMGSETELVRRLAAGGVKCWFATGPEAKHIIRPFQLEREWALLRGYRWGRGHAQMHQPHHYTPGRLSRKNALRALLYPTLMYVYSEREAWARHWEWAVDQGYEDGDRVIRGLSPRWLKEGQKLYISPRFKSFGGRS